MMEKIIICFDLNNRQQDYAALMQVIHAFERDGFEIDNQDILNVISMRYCWSRTEDYSRYSGREIVQNIERAWYSQESTGAWKTNGLTQIKEMVDQKENYQVIYYIRVKDRADNELKNIQCLLLVMQQFPSLMGRIQVFIEPDDQYLTADKDAWSDYNTYHRYSHYLRFVSKHYTQIFYSAFFNVSEKVVCIEQLSLKKPGVQSTFFPLIEVDSECYGHFVQRCALDLSGKPKEVLAANEELYDLLEISKRILDLRIKDEICNKQQKERAVKKIYSRLAERNITALEYAIFSMLVPLSCEVTDESVDEYRHRSESISRGLLQIIENIILHSCNHKGVFTFRIIEDGKNHLNNLLNEDVREDLDRILEIDVADANIFETIIDNFLNKADNKELFFQNINLSVAQFFQSYGSADEKNAWKKYRENNPVMCMGLLRLKQELRNCAALLQVRSDTRYKDENERLIYKKNFFNSDEFEEKKEARYIPGTQFQLIFPIIHKEEKKAHNANILFSSVGNLVERDKFYAKYVDYELSSFNEYAINNLQQIHFPDQTSVLTGMDGWIFKQAEADASKEIIKDKMVRLWKDFFDSWNDSLNADECKVYYFDLGGIKEMISSYGMEAFCKGFIDSGIVCDGKVKRFALINCSDGFIRMMFDTIMMSQKSLGNGFQLYLHADNMLEDLVVTGENYRAILDNALQYCYLRENVPDFIQNYKQNERENESDHEIGKEVELFPFDVLLKSVGCEITLFEKYIEHVADCPLTDTEQAGYLLTDAHMRLGNKVHLKEFYEISILFRKSRIARKIALLIIRQMKQDKLELNQNWLFYGYASYSRAILTALTDIMRCYQTEKHFVEYAVYQNDIMVQKKLVHTDPKVPVYFSGRPDINESVNIVQIVPISTTLTTFNKMWEQFVRDYAQNEKTRWPVQNYTFFWVRDMPENGFEHKPTEIEAEYWEYIEQDRRIKTFLIEPAPKYFCGKEIPWFNPLNCEQCYPENVLDEIALTETDITSTVPTQQIDTFETKMEKENRRRLINEIRVLNLRDSLFYGHISRDSNHFQYYIDTAKYFYDQKENIVQWLTELKKDKESDLGKEVLDIIVIPQHHTNVEFGYYVNEYYFDGNADLITIDPTKEYRSNIVVKYADVKATIANAVGRGTNVRFSYVDDTIITGSTYRRVNTFLHSLVPKDVRKPIQFEKVFVLINRMSLHSRMDYVMNVEDDFHAFVHVSISSIRNFGDSCAICSLQRNSDLFFKRAATKRISEYWEEKKYDYQAVSFDRFQTPKDPISATQGYFRMLCSHYAKERLKISNDDFKKNILGIIRLFTCIHDKGIQDFDSDEVSLDEKNIAYFERRGLSPIYCYAFKNNPLEMVKSYLKILCRPFFSYGKIHRQAILDLLLLLSESFLRSGFDRILLDDQCTISNKKLYLNDTDLRREISNLCSFLKGLIPSDEVMDFVNDCLLEGLTDIRSNYLIRQHTINLYKEALQEDNSYNDANYDKKYGKYEILIHRLINGSADETKSLWMEHLLITGEENKTGLNEYYRIEHKQWDDNDADFDLFIDSLMIENTRLYYDSMFNFVQKAGVVIANESKSPEDAICETVEEMWGDYYIKNLRRFVKLEILADLKPEDACEKEEIEKRIKEKIIETAKLLYLLKTDKVGGIDRYGQLREYIQDLLYPDDRLQILTSARDAERGDQLCVVTDYKKGSAPREISERIAKIKKDVNLMNKGYYVGEDHIVLYLDNNEEYIGGKKIEDAGITQIQPLYFYIECDTTDHFHVILRIRKILMYRHQLLHWIEADFNNSEMNTLVEQMGINRQLMRDRAGDHNRNSDILTIERLLQNKYTGQLEEAYRWLLLKVYVNLRIARLFRCEWNDSYDMIRDEAYTLRKNEDITNKAFVELSQALFSLSQRNESGPKNYFMLMEDIFEFEIDIPGRKKNLIKKIEELPEKLKGLYGRCEDGYYYKQEYIISILFDVFFTAISVCCNWQVELDKYFRMNKMEEVDPFFVDNEIAAYYHVLKKTERTCRITISTEKIEDRKEMYLVLRNRVYGMEEGQIREKNRILADRLETKETVGMSIQAMKWYAESLGGEKDVTAQFFYDWNNEKEMAEFVTKLPVLMEVENESLFC